MDPTRNLLKAVAPIEGLLFRIPTLGEPLLRGLQRAVAAVAFRLPVLGGKPATELADLRRQWFDFLARFGIYPRIDSEDARDLYWSVEECPYGLISPAERGLCDALMDLDRQYVELLGGEMTILERIPEGARRCRFVIRMR